MRRTRLMLLSLAAVGCLFGSPKLASSQVQQGKAKADTMPATVVQRYFDAYNRHDLNGVAVSYDSVYLHDNLGDGKGTTSMTRAAMLDAQTAFYQKYKDAHAKLLSRMTNGPFVVDMYEWVYKGEKHRHLDMYEVRQGKIVHEWEY